MSYQILHWRVHIKYRMTVVPGNFLDLVFVHQVLDSDLLRIRYLAILLPQGVICAGVGLVYFSYNYIFDRLALEHVGAIIALSTE